MSKIFVRTLFNDGSLWKSIAEKERVRDLLNEHGFYVLHGGKESLDVYVTDNATVDIKLELLILAGLLGVSWVLL